MIRMLLLTATLLTATACGEQSKAANDQPAAAAAAAIPPEATPPEVPNDRDGPFGLAMGMTTAEVQSAIGVPPDVSFRNMVIYTTAPTPHPKFSRYVLIFGGATGLCKVAGVSEIDTNRYGSDIRASYADFKQSLAKYGNPTEIDRLYDGSIWDEPEDWMMALLKKERVLASYWGTEGDTLSGDIESIYLQAEADSLDSGSLTIGYDFTNINECLAEAKAKDDAAL